MTQTDDFKGVMDAALEYSEPVFRDIDGVPFLVMRGAGGSNVYANLENEVALLRSRPRRVGENIEVRTPKSLADYMNLYADQNHLASVCAANPHSVRVVLDYHEAADSAVQGAGDQGVNTARWCDHTVTMTPRFTPAYAAWRERHRKASDQRETMEFLEDRLIDVVKPDAADIMDMVMNFEGLTKVTFSSSQRLTDGRVQVVYKEEEADSGRVMFYEGLTLRLPVFEGADPEPVDVRVRHRQRDGKLHFVFVIANIEELERTAFERLCDVWRTGFTAHPLREISV